MTDRTNSSRPKSILRYRPETNNNNSPFKQSKANNSSWFSRFQLFKIYPQGYGSHYYADKQDENSLLANQDLKKVSFSVDNLTTEHPFNADDTPRDEAFEKQKKQDQMDRLSNVSFDIVDLCNYYDNACIQREESVVDKFRNILRTSRTKKLDSIDLSNQHIASHEAGPISDIFMLKFGLISLDLSDCKLDDEPIRIILCSLLVSRSIQHLNLSKNNFKHKGYKYIAIFIKESDSIQSMNLSNCTIEKRGMQYLSQGIQYATSLESLTMDDCTIKPPPETFEILSEAIFQSKTLDTLSLRNNRLTSSILLGSYYSNLIAFNIDSPNGIKSLDLSGNSYLQTAAIMSDFANILRNNSSLLYLKLSDCKINYEGLTYLSDALVENSCLESLDLSKNPLISNTSNNNNGDTSDEGGILALKTSLATNNCLTSLNLSETRLDSSTAIALAEMLPENNSLTRLDLSKNPNIDMAGILALAISIKMNHTLTFLDINIPHGDEELANLQNDIVAVCTTNMLKKVETQKRLLDKCLPVKPTTTTATVTHQHHDEEVATLSPSSSSTSTTKSISILLDQQESNGDVNVTVDNNSDGNNGNTTTAAIVKLPPKDELMPAKQVLDGPESPQLNVDPPCIN